jgi:hypothetical protein
MIHKSFTVIAVPIPLSAVAHAGSAPKELYGKSIIIAWTEQRSQRQLGQANFRDVLVPLSHSVYISTAGRIFDRFVAGSQNPAHVTFETPPPPTMELVGRTAWCGSRATSVRAAAGIANAR